MKNFGAGTGFVKTRRQKGDAYTIRKVVRKTNSCAPYWENPCMWNNVAFLYR